MSTTEIETFYISLFGAPKVGKSCLTFRVSIATIETFVIGSDRADGAWNLLARLRSITG